MMLAGGSSPSFVASVGITISSHVRLDLAHPAQRKAIRQLYDSDPYCPCRRCAKAAYSRPAN